ncbi:endonuclease/exonuclease/phosphatase family protein [Synechococcus sp. PCC 7336]|uniref:endonuclease/exonuclease/phosphatase family protein n=1 Tax=Synechococcus sp. PCC 7336 TaxID=195250 RepID=UPI00034B5298|nr:endonuclease/exonuclease/phosphatase family protein [Synechococcus sp. PCC 7336]
MSTVFINEIHYDNSGADVGEAIEIAGLAGIDLAGWSLVLYNGNGGAPYDTIALGGIIPDQDSGFGTLAFSNSGIQNGSPDGIALVDNSGTVVEFLSYEGSFTAVGGPADGLTSTDIGVAETSSTPVGFSVQRTGTGTAAADFVFVAPADDNFGTVNSGQSFGSTAIANVFINEIHYDNTGADVGEAIEVAGTAGTDLSGFSLVLYNGNDGAPYDTIALSGVIPDQQGGFGTLAFSNSGIQNGSPDGIALVDNNNNVLQFLSYEGSFTAVGGPADGLASTDIGVAESGTTPAGFSVQLTGIGLSADDFLFSPPSADSFGSINEGQTFAEPPPSAELGIFDIQGADHISPFVSQSVLTSGIVTGIDSSGSVRGFYLQDALGDGNIATADGIFVFTGGTTPTVAVGDEVEVEAIVTEFSGSGSDLSVTQLVSPTLTVLSSGNLLPDAVVLGVDRTAPTEIIDNDGLTSFDPLEDGIDFYESLEGVRVAIQGGTALTATNVFGEIILLPDNVGATGINSRGGLTISAGDFNPERLQIDDSLLAGSSPLVDPGDLLGPVEGILSYSFGSFELLATETPTATPVTLTPETTTLVGGADQLTIASYNVENLDPGDGTRFDAIAAQIVNNLNSPDIIGLQEVQDNDGPGNASGSSVTSADQTLQELVDAIARISGVTYEFIDNPFIGDDTNGGEPGGNIRTAFLYNPNRVSLVPGSVQTAVDPLDQQTNPDNPFFGSRLPLAATFSFNGNDVTLVSNHFTSRGGSDPLFGQVQPPSIGGEARREAQAQALNDFVDGILAADPNANVAVLGDFNGFPFESFQTSTLSGGVLDSLLSTLPAEEQYTFVFEGNSQALDNILATGGLSAIAEVDIVHVNAEFPNTQPSDHDPIVAQFSFANHVNELVGINSHDVLEGTAENDLISGLGGRDTIVGGAGDDIIVGGRGRDLLSGGAGSDVFVYEAFSARRDRITDFEVTQDAIDFSQIFASEPYGDSSNPFEDYVRLVQRGTGTAVQIDRRGDIGDRDVFRTVAFLADVSVLELSSANVIV